MLEKIEMFHLAQGLATHAAARQSVIAQNVANADTPGYRAKDVAPFADAYASGANFDLRANRPGHLFSDETPGPQWTMREAYRPGAISPNGNNVSLETEMLMSAEVQQEHELALSIYRSALTILRSSIGRG